MSSSKVVGSEAIIFFPFDGIYKDAIGFGNLFKVFLATGIVPVVVGVVFKSQFPIGFFDFLFHGIIRDAKDFIIIFEFAELSSHRAA